MAKYVIAGCWSHFHDIYKRNIGRKPDRSLHVRDSIEGSIKHIFRVEEDNGKPIDPLEFMVKLNDYILYTLSDDLIIESIMGLGDYVEQGGSIGELNHE